MAERHETFRSPACRIALDVDGGRVRVEVEGAADAAAIDPFVRALEAHLGSEPTTIEIDATRQEGAAPELRARLASVLGTRRAAVVRVHVRVSSSAVELSYRRLAQDVPKLVDVESTRSAGGAATPAGLASCPPPVHVDAAEWPVLRVTPPHQITDDEMQAFLAWYRELVLRRREPFALVLDLRRTSGMTPRQRQMITDGMGGEESIYCRGTAMVFSSAVLRGILTAIFWIRKPRYPTRVFATVEDAGAFAHGLMRGTASASAT